MSSTSNSPFLSRRKFMAGAIGAPLIAASGIVGAQGRPGANSRINLGLIGTGGIGKRHIRGMGDHMVALCDADQRQLHSGIVQLDRKVPTYLDYRYLLEDKGIDAVVIATPDH